MASQSQGIQQLLQAEKRAAEKVAEARKSEYGTARLGSASPTEGVVVAGEPGPARSGLARHGRLRPCGPALRALGQPGAPSPAPAVFGAQQGPGEQRWRLPAKAQCGVRGGSHSGTLLPGSAGLRSSCRTRPP